MLQIQKGISKYRLTDFEVGNPLVIVHPWYCDHQEVYRPPFELSTAVIPIASNSYRANLASLIKNHDGPIILLEEESKVANSARRIKKISGHNCQYIIPTKEDSGEPLAESFQSVADFLRQFKNRVYLSGGFERCYDGVLHVGCLGRVYSELALRGLDQMFVQGCCF